MKPHYQLGLWMINFLVNQTTKGVEVSGTENLLEHPRTLYISNHDDIVREPALINHALHKAKKPLAHYAAGQNIFDNLFFSILVHLQPMFPVTRERGKGLEIAKSIDEQLEKGNPVWVAQSNGRTKNGSHATHPSLLPNLAAAHGVSIKDYLDITAVMPVAISAEVDPVAPMMARRLVRGKRFGDDFVAVTKGIWMNKGKCNVTFCPRLQGDYDASEATAALDKTLQRHYFCFDTHKRACEERFIYNEDEWLKAAVEIDAHHPLVRKQLLQTVNDFQPALATRYAIPAQEAMDSRNTHR